MSTGPDMETARPALSRLAEMTSAVLEGVYARTLVAEGPAFFAAVEMFSDLGRALRLTLGLELRLAAFVRRSAQPQRLPTEASQSVQPYERGDPPEREREREVESDGYPMDPLGRVLALERIITRNPTLDPDHRVGAEIIQLKAFLTQPEPPTPVPPTARPGPPALLGRPLNRTERRRQRHASG